MYLKLRTLLDIVYFPKLPERLGSRLFETQTPSLSLLSESVTDVLSKWCRTRREGGNRKRGWGIREKVGEVKREEKGRKQGEGGT